MHSYLGKDPIKVAWVHDRIILLNSRMFFYLHFLFLLGVKDNIEAMLPMESRLGGEFLLIKMGVISIKVNIMPREKCKVFTNLNLLAEILLHTTYSKMENGKEVSI